MDTTAVLLWTPLLCCYAHHCCVAMDTNAVLLCTPMLCCYAHHCCVAMDTNVVLLCTPLLCCYAHHCCVAMHTTASHSLISKVMSSCKLEAKMETFTYVTYSAI